MNYTGERVVPWDLSVGAHILSHHLIRYSWASQFTYGMRVIDLGCGTGYGTFILSMGAKIITGYDIDLDSIWFAEDHFEGPNLAFYDWDIESDDLPFADIYIAFEVLEHLSNPSHIIDEYRPLIWSIPVNSANSFHKRMYSVADIDTLTGGGTHFQSDTGTIVPREYSWFSPSYVLGITE